MAEFLRDDFAGTNGVTLTGYNAGWNMVGSSGLARIQDQRAYHAGSTAAIYARTDIPAPSADYSVSCDVISAATTGSPSAGPCGRMNGTAQTMYQARYVRGTGIVLAKFINGTAQTIDSTSFTLNSGETVNIRLEMIGTALKVYLNGSATPAISNSDSSITDPGFSGLRFASANTNLVYIDNLVGDAAGGAPAATGTLASALAPAAMSASGAITNAGSFASTLGNAALVAVGTVGNAPSGSFAPILTGAALAASGAVNNRGALASMLDGATLAAGGTVAQQPTGPFASTLQGASMYAIGYLGNEPPVQSVRPYRWRVMRRHLSGTP